MKRTNPNGISAGVAAIALLSASAGVLADSQADLAKQSLNPVADLMSVPIQYNYDRNIGPQGKGTKSTLNIQPVLPFSLNEEWNVISRTILPVIDQQDILPNGAADESGIGDVVQSIFFSPKAVGNSGWMWGAGPVFLLPTASDDVLGAEQWGVGPTAVVLKQKDGFTYGALFNHIWSVTGDDDRDDINATFLQPFLSFTTPTFTTFGINTESTYDWENEQWAIPVHLSVTQLMKVNEQVFSIQAALRYWVDSPNYGPDDLGFRLAVTFMFPK